MTFGETKCGGLPTVQLSLYACSSTQECCCVECHGDECHGDECHGDEYHSGQFHSGECPSEECPSDTVVLLEPLY